MKLHTGKMYRINSHGRIKVNQVICYLIILACVIIFVALIVKTGRDNQKKASYSTTGFSMGTVLSVTIYGEDCEEHADNIISLVDDLEAETLSWRKETSEVYRINQEYEADSPYPISSDLAEYILLAKEISDMGDGLLDITIRPLADAWGIEDGNETVPGEADIRAALSLVDYTRLHITSSNGDECTLKSDIVGGADYFITINEEGMSIDLGALGKGIACDVINTYLENEELYGACIAVGGSIVCYGKKADESNYSIGIRDPRGDENSVMGTISVDASENSVFISTSGDYEKYFIEDGTRYHHILNPKTGYPADTGIISATIVCENGALSDALSTICILLGASDALSLVDYFGAEAVLIDENKNVYITDGLSSNFTLTGEDYNKYD